MSAIACIANLIPEGTDFAAELGQMNDASSPRRDFRRPAAR